MTTPLPPGSTIGIVGGGQLGRMLAQSARQHGYGVVVLTGGAADTPAGVLADREVTGAFDDPDTVATFLDAIDAMTWEFENVDPTLADAAGVVALPDALAAAMVDELARPCDFVPVETDGARRAAAMVAELVGAR